MFEGKYFLFSLEKGVGVLTLNRPPYNIFEAGFYVELGEVEDHIAAQEGIRCLVINANGKCFSAGIDLNYLQGVSSAYVLENAGSKAYYYSISAQLRKKFDFGLRRTGALHRLGHGIYTRRRHPDRRRGCPFLPA